jgi:hypothetical protein
MSMAAAVALLFNPYGVKLGLVFWEHYQQPIDRPRVRARQLNLRSRQVDVKARPVRLGGRGDCELRSTIITASRLGAKVSTSIFTDADHCISVGIAVIGHYLLSP